MSPRQQKAIGSHSDITQCFLTAVSPLTISLSFFCPLHCSIIKPKAKCHHTIKHSRINHNLAWLRDGLVTRLYCVCCCSIRFSKTGASNTEIYPECTFTAKRTRGDSGPKGAVFYQLFSCLLLTRKNCVL